MRKSAISLSVSAALISLALAGVLGALPARADNAAPAAASKDTVRAEVGTPLQAAQGMMKEGKFREALGKIKEAEAIPNRTPYENFIIDRMRGSAAAGAGDNETALSSLESVIASGRLPAAEQLKIEQAVAATYFKLKNYAKSGGWAARYLKEGGTEASMQDMVTNSTYLSGDYAGAARDLRAQIEADERAGRQSTEVHLQMLLACGEKTGDSATGSLALEKLLESYPKKEYWDLAISHLVHRPGFAERLELDLLRLELDLGGLRREGDFMEMAQLDLEVGFPAEAKKALDRGFASGTLGKGQEAEREKRLQAKVNKDAGDDQKNLGSGVAEAERSATGDGMINFGYNYILNGKNETGVALLDNGLKKGGHKRPEDAKLHAGIGFYLAGDKTRAIEVLRSVRGTDGIAELAHLWALRAAR